MKKTQKSQEIMPNKPLPWPYGSKQARDRSAEEAVSIMRILSEITEVTNDSIVLKLTARAIRSTDTILRFMEREGAPTRPE